MKEEELDRIVLGYLRKKGYFVAEQAFCQESGMPADGLVHQLDAEQGVLNSILFFTVADGEPTLYNEAFDKLVNWVLGSLDLYRCELAGILYPLFMYVFLKLHEKGASSAAQQLFNKHKRTIIESSPPKMQRQRMEELQDLQGITSAQHVVTNRTANAARGIRYPVSMCSFAFQLLNRFLSSQDAMLLLLYIINENVRLNVVERSPRMAADSEEGDELQEEGFGLLMMGEAGVAGGEVTAANSQAVKLGLLKDDPEVKYAHEMRVKLEREVEKEEHDKDKGKKKKSLKQDGTKHDDDDGKSNGKATNSTIQFNHAEAEVPIASLDEDEEADFLAGIRRRTIVGTNALPSSVLFTFVNTRQSLNCATVSQDATMVVGGFGDSSIRIYDVEAMADHRMRDAEGRLEAAGCSRTGGEADTACEVDDMDWEGDLGALRGQDGMDNLFAQGSVRRLSKKSLDSLQRRMPQDRDELTVLWGHAGPVYSVSWSANERYLLSSSSDCTIRLWSMDLGSNLVAYHGHSHPIWSVQASPQGHYFASASADKTARIWSTEHRQALRLLIGHQSDVDTVAWHPNCNYVATGSADTTVRLWHVASGDCVRILVGHRSAVCSVATSPCGNQLASGSIDGTICLWDLNEGKRIAQLKGHKGPVWSLCYSHGLQNSPLLASGGADCTLRLWGAAQASYGNLQHANDVMQNGGNFGAYDLLRSCQTKSTPIFSLNFTRTNLLSASGALTLQSRKM